MANVEDVGPLRRPYYYANPNEKLDRGLYRPHLAGMFSPTRVQTTV
jgi:hypothetical protein